MSLATIEKIITITANKIAREGRIHSLVDQSDRQREKVVSASNRGAGSMIS